MCSGKPVIALATGWLRCLSGREPPYSIQYHVDQDLGEPRRYWGRVLDIDGSMIRMRRKSNSGRLSGGTWRSDHGVLAVTVGDTLLRARLQAWIDRVQGVWGLDFERPFGA